MLAWAAPAPQVALARAFGRDLAADGVAAWHGFPLAGVHRDQALAALALAAWTAVRAFRSFRRALAPGLVPFLAAAAATIGVAAWRIGSDGAAGAARAVVAGALVGLALELRRSPKDSGGSGR